MSSSNLILETTNNIREVYNEFHQSLNILNSYLKALETNFKNNNSQGILNYKSKIDIEVELTKKLYSKINVLYYNNYLTSDSNFKNNLINDIKRYNQYIKHCSINNTLVDNYAKTNAILNKKLSKNIPSSSINLRGLESSTFNNSRKSLNLKDLMLIEPIICNEDYDIQRESKASNLSYSSNLTSNIDFSNSYNSFFLNSNNIDIKTLNKLVNKADIIELNANKAYTSNLEYIKITKMDLNKKPLLFASTKLKYNDILDIKLYSNTYFANFKNKSLLYIFMIIAFTLIILLIVNIFKFK